MKLDVIEIDSVSIKTYKANHRNVKTWMKDIGQIAVPAVKNSKHACRIRKQSVPVGQLAAITDQIALEMAIKVFLVFGWVPGEAAVRTLAEDQKKLVERRL